MHKLPPRVGFVETLHKVSRDGRLRWRNVDGTRFYEWDAQHGEFEIYNKRGKHLGVLSADGIFIKKAVEGRTIDV